MGADDRTNGSSEVTEPPAPASPERPPVEWSPVPPPADGGKPPARRSRSLLIVGVIAIGAFIGTAIGVRVVGGLLAPQDPIDAAANEMFGRLPAESRDRLAGELRELFADEIGSLSKDEARDRAAQLTRKGYLRLDDARLIRRLDLQTLAVGRADLPTCSAFERASFGGSQPEFDVAAQIVNNLQSSELEEWFTLAIAAARAELAGSPEPRRVTDAAFEDAMSGVFATYSPDELSELQTVAGDPRGADDEAICRAVRLLYERAGGLGPDALAVVARYDIQLAAELGP